MTGTIANSPVPADDNLNARLLVSQILLEALKASI
jgi:hypothetical protein